MVSELLSHFLVSLIYFWIIVLLRFKFDFSLLYLFLGMIIGTHLLDIDHLIYWFITHSEKEDSIEAKKLWKNKGIRAIAALGKLMATNHKSHHRLIFHTAVFQSVLLLLALFIVSSGGSLFGTSLVMAMNLHLLKDEWQDYLLNNNALPNWLFWQIKNFQGEKYSRLYLFSVTGIFLLLSLFFR